MLPQRYTVELNASGLIGTVSQPDMQTFRIIGFFFENRLHWQFEVGIKSTSGCFRLHIYLHANRTLIHNSIFVFDSWGKILINKKTQYNYSKGHAVAQLVEALRYKPEGRGFDSRWCHWNFSLT